MTDDTDLSLLLREPFPEPEPVAAPAAPKPARARKPRFSRRRAIATLVVVVVLVAAAGGGVWAATGSSAASYRWAAVSKGSVDQTLNSYGTVRPINQADVAFPVSGTIATVPVTVGQKVVAGQTLATLDITSLETTLNSAQSTLATAQAKLVSDTTAQANGTASTFTSTSATSGSSGSLGPAADVPAVPLAGSGTGRTGTHGGGSSSGGSSQGGSGSSGSGSTGSSSGVKSAQAAVAAAQQKLIADQHTADDLTTALTADLQSGNTTCTSLITTLTGLANSNTGSGSSTPVPDSADCTDLLTKVQADQHSVTTAQAAVTADETALTTAIANLVTAAQTQPTPTPTPTPSTTPSSSGSKGSRGGTGTGSTGTGSSGSGFTGSGSTGSTGRSGGATVTAADLVVDQAEVDSAAAAVTVAQQALKQAALVSPLAGTVAEVDVTAGSSVSSSSTAVIVIGPGNDQISTTVGDLDLDKVVIGASATVTPDGTDKPVQGKVTAVGLLPTSSTSASTSAASSSSSSSSSSSTTTASSTATYPVTIALDSGGLYSGSGADVAILVKRSTNVLTVPTTAVTSLGNLHTVTLLDGSKATRKVVTIGATGPTLTEIKTGLTAGQHVALARIDEALPTSGSTALTNRLGRTTGGLTGGTLTGGGTTGGGFGGGGFGGGTGRTGRG